MISPSDYLSQHQDLVTAETANLLRGAARLKKGPHNAAKLKAMADHCKVPKEFRNNQKLLADFLERLQNTITAGIKLQKSGLKVGDPVKHHSWQDPEPIAAIGSDFTLRFKHKKGAFVASNVQRA